MTMTTGERKFASLLSVCTCSMNESEQLFGKKGKIENASAMSDCHLVRVLNSGKKSGY